MTIFQKQVEEDIETYKKIISEREKTMVSKTKEKLPQSAKSMFGDQSENRHEIIQSLKDQVKNFPDNEERSDLNLYVAYCEGYGSIKYGPSGAPGALEDIMLKTLDKVRDEKLNLTLALDNYSVKVKMFSTVFSMVIEHAYHLARYQINKDTLSSLPIFTAVKAALGIGAFPYISKFFEKYSASNVNKNDGLKSFFNKRIENSKEMNVILDKVKFHIESDSSTMKEFISKLETQRTIIVMAELCAMGTLHYLNEANSYYNGSNDTVVLRNFIITQLETAFSEISRKRNGYPMWCIAVTAIGVGAAAILGREAITETVKSICPIQ